MIDTSDLEKLNPKLTKSGKTRSEIGRASKRKGKTGERYFAEKLSEYSGLHFQRVPNSGAFVGQSNRDRLKLLTRTQQLISLGDIICPEELELAMIFESKNHAELDFHNLISDGGSSQLNEWLNELLYDCESHLTFVKGDKPLFGMLCVKITRKGSWCVVNKNNIEKHQLDICTPFLTMTNDLPEKLKFYGWGNIFYMTDFNLFCKINKGRLFRKINIVE